MTDDGTTDKEEPPHVPTLRCSVCRRRLPTPEDRSLVAQKLRSDWPDDLCRCECHWSDTHVRADGSDEQTIFRRKPPLTREGLHE